MVKQNQEHQLLPGLGARPQQTNNHKKRKQNASLIEATVNTAEKKAAHWVLEELRPNQ
jgi:hypothetical protein